MTRKPMHTIKTTTRGYAYIHSVYVTLRTRPVHVMTIIQDPKESSLTIEPVLHPNFTVYGASLRSVLVNFEHEAMRLRNSPPWVRKYPYITPEDLIYVLTELALKVLDPRSSTIWVKTPWARRVHRKVVTRMRRMTRRPKCSMTLRKR